MMSLRRAIATEIDVTVGAADHPAIAEARRLHARTYIDRGFVDGRSNWLDLDTGLVEDPYVARSIYLSARYDGTVVGVARLILPGPQGLPAFHHFTFDPDVFVPPQDQCLEVSSLCIDGGSEVRAAVFVHMVRAFAAMSHRRPEHFWIAIVERPLLIAMNRFYGLKFRPIGQARRYLGGETLPVLLDVPDYLGGLTGIERDFIDDRSAVIDLRHESVPARH